MTAQTKNSKRTQREDTVEQPDERSRRHFLKVSSMLGLGVAFSPRTIADAFTSRTRTIQKEDTMTQRETLYAKFEGFEEKH